MSKKNFINSIILFTFLIFWTILFWLMFSSNLSNLVLAVGFMPHPSAFSSGNFTFMQQTVAVYHMSNHVALWLFLLDVIAQGSVCFLFTAVSIIFIWKKFSYSLLLILPFLCNVILWGSFLILEEFFLAYSHEHAARELLILAVLSLLVVIQLTKRSYRIR